MKSYNPEEVFESYKLPQTWEFVPKLFGDNIKYVYFVFFPMRYKLVYRIDKKTAELMSHLKPEKRRSGKILLAFPQIKGTYTEGEERDDNTEVGTAKLIPREPMICTINTADVLLGWAHVCKKVRDLTGLEANTTHDSTNPIMLKILIKTRREEAEELLKILCGGPASFLNYEAYWHYTLGLTSLVELNNGEVRHLPLIDCTLESISYALKQYYAKQRVMRSAYETLLIKTYKLKQQLEKLELANYFIANSGNSFHVFGRELMRPNTWLGFMRLLEKTPHFDPIWSKMQRNFVYGMSSYTLVKNPVLLRSLGFCLLRIRESENTERQAPRIIEVNGSFPKNDQNQLNLFSQRAKQLNLILN